MKDDGVADAKISKGGDGIEEGSEREKLAGRPRRRNEVHKDERE